MYVIINSYDYKIVCQRIQEKSLNSGRPTVCIHWECKVMYYWFLFHIIKRLMKLLFNGNVLWTYPSAAGCCVGAGTANDALLTTGGSTVIPSGPILKQPTWYWVWTSPSNVGSNWRHQRSPSLVGAKSLNRAQTCARSVRTSMHVGSGFAPSITDKQ